VNHLEMRGITKIYGSVTANDGIDLTVRCGEIHSLLGENGAGKTTLMRILYGMEKPDSGTIYIKGKKVNIKNPQDALRLGIGMVHQHFMLSGPMTVAENITLGNEPKRGFFFDKERAIREVEALSKKYSFQVDPRAKIESLSVGTKQRVEIMKALYRNTDLIILDEPTAVLTSHEVQELFKVLKELRNDGKTIIIITHKLKEIMQISDRVTILRNGKYICTKDTCSTNPQELAEMMVGRKVDLTGEKTEGVSENAPVVLELRNVVYRKNKTEHLSGLSIKLHAGEILGICGVEGNGQTQLIEAVTGICSLTEGEILVNGSTVDACSPRKMIELGIGHIPEERGTRGLVKDFSIRDNIMLGYQKRKAFNKKGIINTKFLNKHAEEVFNNYAVKADSISEPTSSLSGGNQQKVIIGRVLSQNPDIIVAAQPTRGVDIGSIEYIHEKLLEMKKAGKAILLISAELDEILKLSDNIAVIYNGKIVAEGNKADFDEQQLGLLMTGYRKEEKKHATNY
jgi:ABC-type uncharacterized transport system ATPase subunit